MAVLVATTMDGSDGQMPMGLGAVLLIISVFILTPLLSRPLIAAAAPLLRALRSRQAGPGRTHARRCTPPPPR
ncbi:ABC transporter [Streptomyces purpurascens]